MRPREPVRSGRIIVVGFAIVLGASACAPPDEDQSIFVAQQAAVSTLVSYGGGAVLSNVEVIPVFWGPNVDANTRAFIAPFYSELTRNPYIDWLIEYSTKKQLIGRGRLLATVPITPTNTSNNLSDADVQTELNSQISRHLLTSPTANSLYMVHFPPGKSITLEGETSCVKFCGYHKFFFAGSTPVRYAVIPDGNCGACAGAAGVSPFDMTTYTSSHEIVEAITDPDPFTGYQGWLDFTHRAEISDICPTQRAKLPFTTFLVTQSWSNLGSSCMYQRPLAPAVGNPTGLGRNIGGNATAGTSVVYANSAGKVRELFLGTTGTWQPFGDLTDIAVAPASVSEVSSYVRGDNLNAVVYRSADNHIRELAIVGGHWLRGDLTSNSGAPATAVGDPSAYVRADNGTAVVYRNSSNHIVELFLKPTGWMAGDLTALATAPLAASDPVGYVRADNQTGVVYRSADGHIRQLFLGIGWSPQDLTGLGGAPATAVGKPHPYGRNDGKNAVVFRTSDNHVRELLQDSGGSTWSSSDLTVRAGNPPLAASDPMGFVRSDNRDVVVYRGTDNHIWEISMTLDGTGWAKGDLTSASGGPTAKGAPIGYLRRDNFTTVLHKSAANDHIIELALTVNGWLAGDLTQRSGGP